MNGKQLSRRGFLRMGAMTTTGLILAACQPAPAPQPTAAPTAASQATSAAAEPTTATTGGATGLMTRQADGGTITAWGWDKPEFNKVIEDYIKEAAGVTINGQTFGSGDLWNKITTSAAAGVGLPDAFKSGTYDIPRLVEMGAVLDLTDLVAPYKGLIPQIGWSMCSYQGKIWAVPANSPAGGMFWRYDVCQQYGIDPKAINTWDDFVTAGQKLVQDSGGKVQMVSEPKVGLDGYVFGTFQQEYRAAMLSADEQLKIGPDSEAWKNVLVLARKIKDAKIGGQMDEWTEPWYQAIKDGTLAVIPSGTWFVETIKQQAPDSKGKWFFTPFPAVAKDGDRYPNFGSAVCCISSQTKKTDAALEWVKAWCLDPHGSLELGLKTLGISVVSKAALEDPYVNAPHEYFAENQAYWRDATEAFAKSTYVPPVTKLDGEANSIFGTEIEKWWLGKAKDDEFLTNVAKELKSKLKV